jgi:hypothetical protein
MDAMGMKVGRTWGATATAKYTGMAHESAGIVGSSGELPVRIRLAREFAMLLVASGIAGSVNAIAQDGGVINASSSRTQAVADAEQEKEKHLVLQEPPRGELKFDHIQKDILDRIFNTNGPSLKFGGIPTGGGFSLGR